jgi:cellulose synthase operon protein YhjQ
MADRSALEDQNETPEDVATLYSWANLHGAKYRDFSASRAQSREKSRLRVEDALEQERRRAHGEAEARKAAEAKLGPVAEPHQPQPLVDDRPSLPVAGPAPSPLPDDSVPPRPQQAGRAAVARPAAPLREENHLQVLTQWTAPEPANGYSRPAWLAEDRVDMAGPPAQQAPTKPLEESQNLLTNRWFALQGVFEGAGTPAEAPHPSTSRAPVLAVFSLAGGVGKTSLVATLGRALSARGERVLLVDTAAYGLLPFFFGARDQRPGVLRTFTPPSANGDAAIQLVAIDPESRDAEGRRSESASQEPLTAEIANLSRGASRVIVDLATASGATTRRLLRMSPTVLVPVIPDMNSVVSVASIEAFFARNALAAGKQVEPYYLLNKFDASLPLHLDVREVLRGKLGGRLLPFAIRRAPAVSEALAEGMTVVDYAANSAVAEDFRSLAGWVKEIAAPAAASYRGVRWSER